MNFNPVAPQAGAASPPESERGEIKRALAQHMIQQLGRDPAFATTQDWFYALAYFLRGRLSSARVHTWRRNFTHDAKWVYYLSLELLPGRLMKTCLVSQGLYENCREALAELGVNLDDLWDFELEPALGNGGLGRLAACMLESLTTQNYACFGYSIRYEYGMFRQKFENGEQVEHPENWLKNVYPWEFARPNVNYPIQFSGRVTQMNNWRNEILCHWSDTEDVMATGYDLPVVGLDGETVSSVRLWSAKATADFNLAYFNRGNYIEAVKEKSETETLSKVLYPSDTTSMGRELRLKQEYFLVSASLQDILSRFERKYDSFDMLPEKVAIQLNDTHPVLAIPEMMRLLVDIYRLDWERAWNITVRTFAFTNHTLLPEALESWPVEVVQSLLPRHMQIIYEINHRFMKEVTRRRPGDIDAMRRMSLIEESGPRSVRMAHLAIVGSHKVNGVSQMHTELMRRSLFKDFAAFFPGRLLSLTNGISQRRWLQEANAGLSALISGRISKDWLRDLEQLRLLEPFAEDESFRAEFAAVKNANKTRLARLIRERLGLAVDPESLFDFQIKRIHEYKRQLLNILQVIARYNKIRSKGPEGVQKRTVLFSGKAAPGYVMAKLIIHLINFAADVVNNDPAVGDALKIVFVPNYDVQTAEDLIPAGDLSEQISTAGTEASGTGNMKLALNGALTLATHDGANDEIAHAVGLENIFMFGRTVDELRDLKAHGYDPEAIYESNAELKQVLDMIRTGYFSPENPQLFAPIFDSLVRHGDYYMTLADFDSYVARQAAVDAAFQDRPQWLRKAILNVARVGPFSIDRLVRDYASLVWNAKPVPNGDT